MHITFFMMKIYTIYTITGIPLYLNYLIVQNLTQQKV